MLKFDSHVFNIIRHLQKQMTLRAKPCEICRIISISCKSKRICKPRYLPQVTKRFQRLLARKHITVSHYYRSQHSTVAAAVFPPNKKPTGTNCSGRNSLYGMKIIAWKPYLSAVLLRRIIATAPAAATSSISATKVSELSEVEGVEDSSSEEVSDTADDSSSEGVEAAFTVTVQVASTSPFFTVIVTSPALSAVTSPSLTVAMVSSELVQTRVLSLTFSGESVAASVSFPPTSSSAVVLSSVIPVARTAICSLSP